MTPATVAGFILLDPHLPRSIHHCVRHIELTLEGLLAREELRLVSFPLDTLNNLKALSARTPKEVIAGGLHEYLDEVQLALLEFGHQVDRTFFHAEYASQQQQQSQ
jgi:uncharacterized alpha-E superfamily protein